MLSFKRLAMTGFASDKSRKSIIKLSIVLSILIIFYVIVRNYYYLQHGMLAPDFTLIERAYNFNLLEFPLILITIALLSILLANILPYYRRIFIVIAAVYLFFGVNLFLLRHYVTYIEPEKLVVRNVRLETPKVKETIRILHITDIQAAKIEAYQEMIFDKIESLNPDLIINTGDFLQIVPPANFNSEWEKLHHLIKRVNPHLGTYGVFGDTEKELYTISTEELKPLIMLSSRDVRIENDSCTLSLHGLSLYQSKSGEWALRSVEHWLERSNPQDFKILFGHAPDFAISVGALDIDLCLAGHTHGGQVNLPFYGPLVIDSMVPREWARGFHRVGVPFLNVSAGAGSNRSKGLPPLRFNCPTEMSLIELIPIQHTKK